MPTEPKYVKIKLHHYQLLCGAEKELTEIDEELKKIYKLAEQVRKKRKDVLKTINTLLHGAVVE